MICDCLHTTLGLSCHPLNEDGSMAVVSTPFTFDDGDGVPVFVETVGGHVRFFDDGEILLHFMGRGLSFEDSRKTKFIRNIATTHGLVFTEDGELEVWTNPSEAPSAFARFVAGLLAIVDWERSQKGVSADASLLIEEVAMCIRSWKRDAEIKPEPEYVGISGHTYKLDFSVDGEAIVAITPHPASVSAALKKMVDIISAPANAGLSIQVVLDDRSQPEEARSEGVILNAVANVLMMSTLEKLAQGPIIAS